MELEEIDLVYNSGKDVVKNFSTREYKKRINAASIIHARDRLFIILKNEKKGNCNIFYRYFFLQLTYWV